MGQGGKVGTDEGGELEGLGVVDDGAGNGDAHRRLQLLLLLPVPLVSTLPLLLLLLFGCFFFGRRGAAVVLLGVLVLLPLLPLVLLAPRLLSSGRLAVNGVHGGGGGRLPAGRAGIQEWTLGLGVLGRLRQEAERGGFREAYWVAGPVESGRLNPEGKKKTCAVCSSVAP